jgi:hypothetical protein
LAPVSDEEWSEWFAEVAASVKKVENLGDGLHSFQEAHMETTMNRFLAISSAEDPFPYLARQEMKDLGIVEGDMTSVAARTALLRQKENEGEGSYD